LLGVEGGENIAEMVVRWRSVAKRPEPTQKSELPVAKASDIDNRLRPGQHNGSTSSRG
jgi:hypothetical protein